MEKQLRSVLRLSLEEVALRRVVVNLCNEADVLASFRNFRLKNFRFILPQEYDKICGPTVDAKVRDKVSKLGLVEPLKKRMVHLIRPLVLEIIDWIICHQKISVKSSEYFDVNILEQLYWTSAGAIDYQETAVNLVCLEALDIEERYKLACLYCLVDCIPALWEELPEDIKTEYMGKDPMVDRHINLDYYWAYILKKKESEKDDVDSTYLNESSFNKNAFEASAYDGNIAATEYFFQKLSSEMRVSFLYRTLHSVLANRGNPIRKGFSDNKISEVFCYLFSQLRPEHQMQVLKNSPDKVLWVFLDWPLQDFFLDITDLIWTFYPQNKYKGLLAWLISHIRYVGYYFPNLMQTFFLRSPMEFRKHFVCELGSILNKFSYVEDAETVEVFFKNVDLGDKSKLVSSAWFLKLLRNLATTGKCQLAEICVREASLSNEDKLSLKKTLVNGKKEWKEFFEFLEETELRK